MGRGFKRPTLNVSVRSRDGGGSPSSSAAQQPPVAASVEPLSPIPTVQDDRPRSRSRRSKSSMAAMAGGDGEISSGKLAKLQWSPGHRHIVAAKTSGSALALGSGKSLLSSSTRRMASPNAGMSRGIEQFFGQGSQSPDCSPGHSRSVSRRDSRHDSHLQQGSSNDEVRSTSRIRLLPLDRKPQPETPRSTNHFQVPDLLLPQAHVDDSMGSDEDDMYGYPRRSDSRSFLTKQVEYEVGRLLARLDEQSLEQLQVEQRAAEAMQVAATIHDGENKRQTRPLTLEEAKMQLIERNKARGIEEHYTMSNARHKDAIKVSKTSERLLRTRYEAKAPIKNISVKERNVELDQKLEVFRRDASRRAALAKSLENLKALEIEQRGGTDWVKGNISKADHGEYRYWSEMEKLILRTTEQAVRLRHHRKSRRQQWLQERDNLHDMLRQKEEKRLAMKAQKERQLLLDRLRGKQFVLFPTAAAAARIFSWTKAVANGRIERALMKRRLAATAVLQRNLSAMLWRKNFNRKCLLKAFMRRHSWKIMMKVSIYRKKRGADVIATSIRESMSRNKTLDAMHKYKHKVVAGQRRTKSMLGVWRAQLTVLCQYWTQYVQKKIAGQLSSSSAPAKGKKGTAAGKGSKAGGSSKGKTPPSTGIGSRQGKGGKKAASGATSKADDSKINFLFVPLGTNKVVRDLLHTMLKTGRKQLAVDLALWRKEYRDWIKFKRPMFEAEAEVKVMLMSNRDADDKGKGGQRSRRGSFIGSGTPTDVAREIDRSTLDYSGNAAARSAAAANERFREGWKGIPHKWSEFQAMQESERDANEFYRDFGPPRPVLRLLPTDAEITPLIQIAQASNRDDS